LSIPLDYHLKCGPFNMDIFNTFNLGFSVALTPINLLHCLFGVLLGTLIGVLPGIGSVATIAMLLPITFHIPPMSALIMLAGIYYGAQYGGSTTSILVNIPGEAASVVTCLDGYVMARQGRAGPALSIAAIASFIAGCLSTIAIFLFSPPLAKLAFKFGPPEYFSLMVLGLIAAVVLTSGSLIKAIAMVFLGLVLGSVGTDVNTGMKRFCFGLSDLSDGIGFVTVAMGLFGFAEIIANLEHKEKRLILTSNVKGLMPTRADFKNSWKAILRGTILGSVMGILPGGGATISSFASYTLEKRLASDPSRFGKGAIEGVAGPEAANNSAAQTSFIPLLTLGIPGNPVMALMFGAMMIHGIAPGPRLMTEHAELFYGIIASMWLGNLMLLILNLPLVGIWVRLLMVPYELLFPAILMFCCIGVYSINNASIDVALTAGFGLLGYLFNKLECPSPPLILGFILGPMMEETLRRTMLLSRGDPSVFFTSPISLAMLVLAAFLLVLLIMPTLRKKREESFED
jgi:putative tricarboxylic transport membrane protein